MKQVNSKSLVDNIFDASEELPSQLDTTIISPSMYNDTKIIAIKNLHANQQNREVNPEKVEQMAKSIALEGLLQYPLVIENDKNDYTIISGHHRIAACLKLVSEGNQEFAFIRCKVVKKDPIDNEMQLIDTNLTSNPLSPYEMMMAIGRKEELLKEKKKKDKNSSGSIKDIILAESDLKRTQVGTYIKIYKDATNEVKSALKNNEINLSQAHKLCKIVKEKQNVSLSSLHKKDNVKNNKEVSYSKLLKNCESAVDQLYTYIYEMKSEERTKEMNQILNILCPIRNGLDKNL